MGHAMQAQTGERTAMQAPQPACLPAGSGSQGKPAMPNQPPPAVPSILPERFRVVVGREDTQKCTCFLFQLPSSYAKCFSVIVAVRQFVVAFQLQ